MGNYLDLNAARRVTGLKLAPTDRYSSQDALEDIADVETRIDATLRFLGYSVIPLTDEADIRVVRRFAQLGLKAEAYEAIDHERAAEVREVYETEYDRFEAGKYRLPSANRGDEEPAKKTEDALYSDYYDNPDNDTGVNYPEPHFKSDQEF